MLALVRRSPFTLHITVAQITLGIIRLLDSCPDDQGLLSLDEATLSVDALVADSTADNFENVNPLPLETISRTSTVSVPPGFDLPHAHPAPAQRSLSSAVPAMLSRIVPTTVPFTPSRSTPAFVPRAPTPLAMVSTPTTPVQATLSKSQSSSVSKAKEDLRASATKTGLSKSIASQSSLVDSTQVNLQGEEFPALGKGPANNTPISGPTKPAAKGTISIGGNKKQVVARPSTNSQEPAQSEKSPAPGILNISIPAKTPSKASVPGEILTAQSAVAFPPLPPTTPSSTAMQSPVSRLAPKTLRVLPTPKSETANPVGSVTPSSTTSAAPPAHGPSRQPSLASISRFERPGTPSSEIISDNASIASPSISRANSPPPSKVGSAPLRITTKSMQKKQRKEAMKVKEKIELEVAPPKPEADVEVAPIMGRKKKQKKEKTVGSAAGGSTPAASRPPSPVREEPLLEEEPVAKLTEKVKEVIEAAQPVPERPEKTAAEAKGKAKAKAGRTISPELTPAAPDTEPEPSEKPVPTPASTLQGLVAAGLIREPLSLAILRNPSINLRHPDPFIDVLSAASQKLKISANERARLLSGHPVHQVEGSSRILLTPNGDCLRNLTPEEEERYLELQARIAKDSSPAAFFSQKHHASNGFTLIGGRAVPNGPPSFFPQPAGSGTTIDPVSKIQRDEALSYINQYVLPSLATNSQLEKALDANALNPEILRSGGESSTWAASWGSDTTAHSHPETPAEGAYTHQHQHEGILASGLANMTAHFTTGSRDDRGQALGNVTMLSVEEAETALQLARKEADAFEKKMAALVKKNKRLLVGSGH